MAADALVSDLLKEVISIVAREIRQEVRQVVGVRKEVKKLGTTLSTIKAVLADAEERQVKDEAVKNWLEMLKDISYEMDDVLDDWATSILKAQIEGVENAPSIPKKKVFSCIPSPCFNCFGQVGLRRDIALKIKGIRRRLDLIDSEKKRYHFKSITNPDEPEQPKTEEPERQITSSLVHESEVFGRDDDKKAIIEELLGGSSSQEERGGLHIISIVGLGGIGKTTLAQLAFNNVDVEKYFEERIWVCVSDPFDKIRIARAIAKALDGSDPSSLEWEDLSLHVHNSIAGKKFLLVLDDVWTEDFEKWESLKLCLKSGAQGSRTLVTTRKEDVARRMGTTHMRHLGELSDEVCRSLFFHKAFLGRSIEGQEKLVETGRKIADRCKGLPLAVKTIGSLMCTKDTEQEWQDVLDSELWKLEEVEKGIFPPLLFSYFDLPSELKRCFSYCAIFPKDHVIEKEKLTQLWMANGYLSSRGSTEMEMTGRDYFQKLVMRSFFQDFEKDEDGNIRSCKMHDILHDFAQFLSKNECFIMEVDSRQELSMDSSHSKCRHSTVILEGAPFPVSINDAHNLRSLLVQAIYKTDFYTAPALPDLFQHLKCLRALDLSGHALEKLPEEVGNLIHLRYLNLSYSKFQMLPGTVCDLCNLLVLDLTFCRSLMELPKGMGKLINLRHLHIGGTPRLTFMLKEIGRLRSLRTLSKFIVGCDNERELREETCKLEDLINLNNLQGHLKLEQLGYVENVNEAKKVELIHRKCLIGLEFDFFTMQTNEGMDDVIEALQPHPNLEFFAISYYKGSLLPNWMMSLTKLRRLGLDRCYNVVRLPPLWKLQFLESLIISNNRSLKKVGVEFLGLGTDEDGGPLGKDDRPEASTLIAFPKLKELALHSMKCEEWDAMITTGKKEEKEITIMPCLRSLSIKFCPKLKALPDHFQTLPLEKLTIEGCPTLKQRYQRGIGEDWNKISHIPNIKIYS